MAKSHDIHELDAIEWNAKIEEFNADTQALMERLSKKSGSKVEASNYLKIWAARGCTDYDFHYDYMPWTEGIIERIQENISSRRGNVAFAILHRALISEKLSCSAMFRLVFHMLLPWIKLSYDKERYCYDSLFEIDEIVLENICQCHTALEPPLTTPAMWLELMVELVKFHQAWARENPQKRNKAEELTTSVYSLTIDNLLAKFKYSTAEEMQYLIDLDSYQIQLRYVDFRPLRDHLVERVKRDFYERDMLHHSTWHVVNMAGLLGEPYDSELAELLLKAMESDHRFMECYNHLRSRAAFDDVLVTRIVNLMVKSCLRDLEKNGSLYRSDNIIQSMVFLIFNHRIAITTDMLYILASKPSAFSLQRTYITNHLYNKLQISQCMDNEIVFHQLNFAHMQNIAKDTVIEAKGGEIKCHATVVAAMSDYLQSMLFGGFKEAKPTSRPHPRPRRKNPAGRMLSEMLDTPTLPPMKVVKTPASYLSVKLLVEGFYAGSIKEEQVQALTYVQLTDFLEICEQMLVFERFPRARVALSNRLIQILKKEEEGKTRAEKLELRQSVLIVARQYELLTTLYYIIECSF